MAANAKLDGHLHRPLHPEGRDQGDPYLLQAAQGAPFRYYVYVTGEDASGAAFPVYGSPDLIRWTA